MNLEPRPNETQAEHFDRCYALASGDTDAKRAACLSAWRNARGGDPKADERFPPDKFQACLDKVVYAEHEYPRGDGKSDKYDRAALVAIAENMNRRVRDTGDVPPIVEGHTPSAADKVAGARMPAILGYQSNFRVAKIGNENPRYALVCDEFHHKEDAAKLRKMPRRSVEIWLDPDIKKRYWDPCAALGAETPRLDLGIGQLHKTSSGMQVAKYAADACLPGGSNGFVPGVDAPRKSPKERYSMSPEEMQALAAQLVPMIVQALKAEAAPAAEAPPAAPPAPPAVEPEPAKMGDGEMPDMDDPEKKKEMAKMQKSVHSVLVAKYGREIIENAKYSALVNDHAKAIAELTVVRAEKSQALRRADYAKAKEEGYLFDEAKELELTKGYSDEQFAGHMTNVVRANYAKVGSQHRLFVPDPARVPNGEADVREKASRLATQRVLAASAAGERGEKVDYAKQKELALKELGAAV